MTTRPQTPHPSLSDERLFALFAGLPRLAPGAGFVDRVMSVLPRRSWLDSGWTRFSLAAAMLAVALTSALVLPAAISLLRLAGPATILGYWIGGVSDLFAAIGESLSAFDRLAGVGRALAKGLAEPRALALLLANILLAAGAFRGLVALSPKRSTSHAALAS